MLDEEPILLLRLRGREWQALQQALRARRTVDYLGGLPSAAALPTDTTNGNMAHAVQTDQAASNGESLEQGIDHFWGSRKALESLHYYIAPPIIELALLRRLGPLPATLSEPTMNGLPEPGDRALHEQDIYQEMAKIYRQVTIQAQALAYSLDATEQTNGSENREPEDH